MRSLKRSKPKTFTDRVKTTGAVVADAGKAVGNAAHAVAEVVIEGAKTARDRVLARRKSASSGFELTRGKAVAAAAGAVGAAAGAVAIRRKSQGAPDIKVDPAKSQGGPDIKVDPAKPEPTSVVTTETPEAKAAKAAKEAAPAANGASS